MVAADNQALGKAHKYQGFCHAVVTASRTDSACCRFGAWAQLYAPQLGSVVWASDGRCNRCAPLALSAHARGPHLVVFSHVDQALPLTLPPAATAGLVLLVKLSYTHA